MVRLSEVSVAWWESNIRRAYEREDALGKPWTDAPTADELQYVYTYLVTFLAADERGDASWDQIVTLLPVIAHVTLKWPNPDSDVIGAEMCRPLEDHAAAHAVALVSRFTGESDAWFREDWSVGKTILEETKASITIDGTVNKLRGKLAEVQSDLLNHPLTKLPNVLTDEHRGQTVNIASFCVLLQRWLKLYFTYSMTRRGDTYQRHLQRSEPSEPSKPNAPAWYKRLGPRKVKNGEQDAERTKPRSNAGLWVGLVITSLLALSALGRPNFGFVPFSGLPNGTVDNLAQALGYNFAILFLSYIPFIYFTVRYIIRWRKGA